MDDPQDRRTNDAHVNEQLKAIREDLHQISHGNGRQGLRHLLDDVYGPKGGDRPGLIARVVLIEAAIRHTERRYWIQIGVAIGVGLLTLEVVFGLDLRGAFGAWAGTP